MTGVVDLEQRPGLPDQGYALWDTGRIDVLEPRAGFSGAVPIVDGPKFFDALTPPARAIHITNWNTPAGYVMTHEGLFYPFGGAPELGPNNVVAGVPWAPGLYRYVDWAWDPNGTGQGYVLGIYGTVTHFGGATPCPRSGALWGEPIATQFEMQWEPFKRSLILDVYGSRNQDFPRPGPFGQTDGYFDPSRNWARSMVITDWGDVSGAGAIPSGYLLTADGVVYRWGPNRPQAAFGGPSGGQRGNQEELGVMNPADPLALGDALADPLILLQVGKLGQQSIYTSSTPPVVMIRDGSPAAIVTDTSRPLLAFTYSDPERDRLAEWQMIVWPQSYVDTHDMTDPRANRSLAAFYEFGTDSTTRGIVSPVDLANGYWHVYVRAKDTAGQFSPWADKGWQQNVPEIAAPTTLLATVDRFQVNLALTIPTLTAGSFVVFEQSDDRGLTWDSVRGAESVPALTTTYAVDYEPPLGLPRTYRARIFTTIPRSISAPSAEQVETVQAATFVLTSTAYPTLGGEVWPVGSMEWEREAAAGVFDPTGAKFPIVISDGKPKAQRRTLTLDSADRVQWAMIAALVDSGGVLVLREPFGEVVYCAIVGGVRRDQIRALASPDELNALAHVHEVSIPLVEVARPLPVPAEDV